MDADYEKRHFVSYEYLSAWQNEKSMLSVYKKEDGRLYKRCRTEEFIAENEVRYMSHEELQRVFSCLLDYDVSIENSGRLAKLREIHEYADNYCDFQKWMVAGEDGIYLRKQRFRDSIEKSITDVMNGHKKKEEEKWSTTRGRIIDRLADGKKMSEAELHRLISYMSYQIAKSPSAVCRLKGVLDFSDSGNVYKNIFAQLKLLHIVFVKPVGRSFYTSDNPVLVMSDRNFLKGEYNGIYLPLSPKSMAALYKGKCDTYSLTSFESNVVRRFNIKIRDNCSRYFFC